MNRFSGFKPGRDIDIGLCPGEELFEELLLDEENTTATWHENTYTAKLAKCDTDKLTAILDKLEKLGKAAK